MTRQDLRNRRPSFHCAPAPAAAVTIKHTVNVLPLLRLLALASVLAIIAKVIA
jgi:hypothetical protein